MIFSVNPSGCKTSIPPSKVLICKELSAHENIKNAQDTRVKTFKNFMILSVISNFGKITNKFTIPQILVCFLKDKNY